MLLKIEYDDGKPIEWMKDRTAEVTPRGRKCGYYIILPDDSCVPLPLGYMRHAEMGPLEDLLNSLYIVLLKKELEEVSEPKTITVDTQTIK